MSGTERFHLSSSNGIPRREVNVDTIFHLPLVNFHYAKSIRLILIQNGFDCEVCFDETRDDLYLCYVLFSCFSCLMCLS